MEQGKKQLCSIGIMFPVESDEQAIDYKKKVEAALADNPEARIQFSIISSPPNPTNPRGS